MKPPTLIQAVAFLALCATTSLVRAQADSHAPPAVRIVSPEDGETFLLGNNIQVCALSQSFTDALASVEFFAGTNSLGVVSNNPVIWGDRDFHLSREEYSCFTWSNAAAGDYTLTAQATDLAGNSVTSAPVDISVVTNIPPVVRILAPRNGATILGPTNITIRALSFDPGGKVVSVEFFEDANSLGVVSNTSPVLVTNRYGVFSIPQLAYSLTWSNVATGTYSLTAVATDNGGVSSTSSVVDITVATNLPPVVRIVTPESGARYLSTAHIEICAEANDPAGSVVAVDFLAGTNSIGVVTGGVNVTNFEHEVQTFFCLTWSNMPPAAYTLTAVATNNSGMAGTSGPVEITVVAPPPPLVRIVSPDGDDRFFAPANIYIASQTRYFTNPVASVEFLANLTILGVVSNSSWPTFHWTNVPAGAYSLTAIASDTNGLSVTSAPVNVTVSSNRPPPIRWGRSR